MNVLVAVIDGMGGRIGSELISQIVSQSIHGIDVIAVGTNAWATQSMVKAGAHKGATGENAVKVVARSADIIVGPIGIIIANAMMGEITPIMAESVSTSAARKILIPLNQSHFEIVGLENKPLVNLIKEAVSKIQPGLTAKE